MALVEAGTAVSLHPAAGFVIKTRIVEGSAHHVIQTKVFLNICHDRQVPRPPSFDPETVFPMIVRNEWEVPIVVSREKSTTDKKGVPSFVYDCCINSECFNWIQINPDLRMIVVEWCIEAVELMYEVVLEREYTTPKMAAKGDLGPIEMTPSDLSNGLRAEVEELRKNEIKGLLLEIEHSDDDDSNANFNPGELPSIMDISGSKRKPIIQEILEMRISENDQHTSAPAATAKPVASESHADAPLSVTTHRRPGHWVVEVSGFGTDGNVDVLYIGTGPAGAALRVGTLEMPLPAAAEPYRAFRTPTALFVFCRVPEAT